MSLSVDRADKLPPSRRSSLENNNNNEELLMGAVPMVTMAQSAATLACSDLRFRLFFTNIRSSIANQLTWQLLTLLSNYQFKYLTL